MPWNRIDVRVNSVVSPLNSASWLELTDFSVGYYGIATCTLTDKRIKHEQTALAYPNDLIELSIDHFSNIIWKGRVSKYVPGGVTQEGVTVECVRLEDILRRRTCRWNSIPNRSYNRSFLTDVTAPDFDGTVSDTHRWTLGQILVDVLEHAFGINTPSRLIANGGFANGPLVSAIPLHHPDPTSVTDPYASVATLGPARDYLDQLIWDAAEIMALLDIRIPDLSFQHMDLWEVIEAIVQGGGEHGVFIDPTQEHTPRLVVHKFSTSTLCQLQVGQHGTHVETPSFRVKDDQWEYSDEHVKNIIVIEGTGTIGHTDPTLPEANPLSGKLDKIDAAGKFYRVRNQDVAPFLIGYDAVDHRALTNSEKKNAVRPRLWKDGALYTDQIATWIPPGLLCLEKGVTTGDLRIEAMFEKPFQIRVGPGPGECTQRPAIGPGSVARYPVPTAFDAFVQFGIAKELHLHEPEFTDGGRKMEQMRNIAQTLPPTGSKPDGKFVVAPMQRRKLDALGVAQFMLATERDDTGYMVQYAEEVQRRFRDISIKLTLTLDGIRLEDLWRLDGNEVGLRKRVSLIGLEGNRWSDAQLQVMSVRVSPPKNEMIVECSSTIYNVTKMYPHIWKRRVEKQKSDKTAQAVHDLMYGDTVADQGSPAPDGEPSLQGMRQLAHDSPSPRFVRYPGFRKHVAMVTAVPETGLGVYEGTRIDEFYQDESTDTTVKFFNLNETLGGTVLLAIRDVVGVFPVYRDSLQILLGNMSGSNVEVQQDEANVSVGTAIDTTFKAVLYDRKPFLIPYDLNDPIFAGGGGHCPPLLQPLFRGEYSWFEVEEEPSGIGRWRLKEGGRFGVAGQCDAAHEYNRSNTAVEREQMVVDMHEGGSFSVDVGSSCPSSDDVPSTESYFGESGSVRSTEKRYWFNLNIPRSCFGNPYVIGDGLNNDFPP